MLRAGRFRHRLLDETFLETQSPLAIQCLQTFFSAWKKNELSDPEMAAIYILIFSFLRRPKDFLGGVHNQNIDGYEMQGCRSSTEVVDLFRQNLPPQLRDLKSLTRLESPKPFLEHFCSMSWRSIPLSVSQSLMAWQSGRYPLRLMTTVPSPEDVLEMQAQGCRCVSMLTEQEQIQNFVSKGRDVLGFIVHDLIHADHFFADAEKAHAQIHFSQKLLKIRALPEIQEMLVADSEFESEFHYLMSDMNSVPLHLFKTLKAILLGHFKRREGIPLNSPLPPESESSFATLFEIVVKTWNFTSEDLMAAHRLNTPHYKGPGDATLLHLALSRNLCDESSFFVRI